MERLLQLGILPFLVLFVKGDDFDYCYAKDKNPYEFFSTWTAYDKVKGWHNTEIGFGCEPIYAWGLIKHGVRDITDEQIKRSKDIFEMKLDVEKNNEENRCALCWDDFQNIHSFWSYRLDKKQEEDLAKKAYSNHNLFALKLGNYVYPSKSLVKNNFDISKVKGANDSAIKFTNRLLRTNYDFLEGNGITVNEALLRGRDNCAKWSGNNKESNDFISTPAFQATRMRISNRLGFTYPISVENITTMYESCIFLNTLPAIKKPPLCAVFLPEDLKVMEYWQDLKHYYEFGYGNPLSEKMGCPLVKDMVDKLSEAAKNTKPDQKGTFYFADDENMMGVLTKMGLYRDDVPPKHDNYQWQKTNAKWKSSLLSPFTATMHVVLFNCNNNQKQVEFYHNENIIKFDACKGTVGQKCSLDIFLNEVKKNLKEDKCDDKFCGSFPSASNTMGYSFLVMVFCFLLSRL